MSATVVAVKDQVSSVLGEEAVILHLKDGIYYGLNSVGAAVWNLIQTPQSVADIHTRLLEEFDVAAGQCEQDLMRLLEELEAKGLVEISDETAA